jgi:hypothetical protein
VFEALRPASQALVQPGRIIRTIAIAAMLFTVFGCISTGDGDDQATQSPTPTFASTPLSESSTSSVRSSVLPVRHMDEPERVLGSAVVITESGYLLTASDVLDSAMEVVLPDGSAHRPALVSVDSDLNLAMLKVPADDLDPVTPSGQRPGDGSEVFATGYDSSPSDPGRISGTISHTEEPDPDGDYRVRGTVVYETDMNLIQGFVGGALTVEDGTFCGVLVGSTSMNGEATFQAVSQWYVIAWLEDRDRRLAELREQSASWESSTLPGGWAISHPEDWGISVQTDDADRFRAELTPGDPDVSLQLAISVEENDYGTDPDSFISDVFEDRGSARIWSVDEVDGRSRVRATISQEGALVDVAYLLDEEFLIAVSLTAGYQPDVDQTQVDQARALFETVVESIEPGG